MVDAARDHSPPEAPLEDIFDFLDWVQGQEGRYEFVDGRITGMAGGSRAHNDLQMNLLFMLMTRLKGGPCRVNGPDLLIRTDHASDRRGRFADASIECEPPTHHRLSERPTVIFEILSPETELIDRSVKLREYQALPSLHHYVLVAQEVPRVEVYSRHESGGWLYRDLRGEDAVLALAPPGLDLPLRELYSAIGPSVPPP